MPGNQIFTQNTTGMIGGAEAGDLFGWDVAAGNVGGTSEADLAVGVPLEDRNGKVDVGVVNVVYGSPSGLTTAGNQAWDEDGTQTGGFGSRGDEFGNAVTIADFGGTARGDLAIGSSGHDVGTIPDAGEVFVLYGTVDGLAAGGAQEWTEDVTQSQNGPFHDDLFGADVGAGDYDGNGVADLAVGVVLDDVGSIVNAGGVVAIYGGAGGLDGAGAQHWDENTGSAAQPRRAGRPVRLRGRLSLLVQVEQRGHLPRALHRVVPVAVVHDHVRLAGLGRQLVDARRPLLELASASSRT